MRRWILMLAARDSNRNIIRHICGPIRIEPNLQRVPFHLHMHFGGIAITNRYCRRTIAALCETAIHVSPDICRSFTIMCRRIVLAIACSIKRDTMCYIFAIVEPADWGWLTARCACAGIISVFKPS